MRVHVIPTLLFNTPAFKNVIVSGIVLADDGKRTSERLKNYPDPTLLFNTYGADALGLYLFSSSVVEADNLRFSENGVKEVLKILLIPLYNSLGILKECSNDGDVQTEMDAWIVSSFSNLCSNVTNAIKITG